MNLNKEQPQGDTHTPNPALNVLKNTYMLMSVMLAVTAAACYLAMYSSLSLGHILLCLVLIIPSMVVTHYNRDSIHGVVPSFVTSALLGTSLGPLINVITETSNGTTIVLSVMATTATLFAALALLVVVRKKDFSDSGYLLIVALLAILLSSVVCWAIGTTFILMVISAVSVIIFSGFILYDTSTIMSGEETNYIVAANGLYLSVINLFLDLLRIAFYFFED